MSNIRHELMHSKEFDVFFVVVIPQTNLSKHITKRRRKKKHTNDTRNTTHNYRDVNRQISQYNENNTKEAINRCWVQKCVRFFYLNSFLGYVKRTNVEKNV